MCSSDLDSYGKNHYCGTDINFDVDFMALAKAYGIKAYSVKNNKEFDGLLPDILAYKGPTLIECHVHPDFIRI